jgi:hypothetical protein
MDTGRFIPISHERRARGPGAQLTRTAQVAGFFAPPNQLHRGGPMGAFRRNCGLLSLPYFGTLELPKLARRLFQ